MTKHLWWTSLAALLVLMMLPLAQAATNGVRPEPITEGTIDYVNVAQHTVVFMDSVYGVAANADIRSANGYPLSLSELKPNTRIKINIIGKNAQGLPMINKISVVK